MDKMQRTLIILSLVIVIFIVAIVYNVYKLEKNKKLPNNLVVEEGNINIVESEKEEVAENKEEIVETINLSSELVINHLNREELFENASLVVYGKVLKKEDVNFEKEIKYPFTKAQMEVVKVIKGTLPLDSNIGSSVEDKNKKINFKVPGGKVSLNKYIKFNLDKTPEEIAKKGYDKLTEEEKQNKFIQINYEYSNPFSEDSYYVLLLSGSENNYIVPTYTCMIPAKDNLVDVTKEDIMKMPDVEKVR